MLWGRRARRVRSGAPGLGAGAILGLTLAIGVASPVAAYSLPSSPSYSIYVSGSWGNTVTFNGQQVLYAYELGYDSTPGSSANIVIDFHRQEYISGYGWGVCEDSCVYYTDAWVKSVAQAFINGYAAGHSSTSVIAIGVSNDDYNWACSSGGVATAWASAGTAWAGVINSLTEQYNTLLRAADDFESWPTSGWVACGQGAVNWLNAYTSGTSSTGFLMEDFGSDANAEQPSYWSVAQVWDVSWGIGAAVPEPEIYCNGNQQEWVGIRQYGSMTFFGASSENGKYWGSPCASSTSYYTFTWQQSWDNLNSALANAGYSNDLESSATIF